MVPFAKLTGESMPRLLCGRIVLYSLRQRSIRPRLEADLGDYPDRVRGGPDAAAASLRTDCGA